MNQNKRNILFIILYCMAISLWLRFCFGKIPLGEKQQPFEITDDFLTEQEKDTQDTTDYEKNQKDVQKDSVNAKDDIKNQSDTNLEHEMPYEGNDIGWNKTIRVLIKADDGNIYHKKVILEHAGEKIEITENSKYFYHTDRIKIRLLEKMNNVVENEDKAITLCSVNRNGKHPSYAGSFDIFLQEEGFVVVNEVPLEEYVKGVLPGEMPATYPPEALKAQAICARTYACLKVNNPSYQQFMAEVDDSTACQVYGYHKRTSSTDFAVEETKGLILKNSDKKPYSCYYYSTSCGTSAPEKVWHGVINDQDLVIKRSEKQIWEMNRNFKKFITTVNDSHLEKEEPYYRWQYIVEKLDEKLLFQRIQDRQNENEHLIQTSGCLKDNKMGKIKNMRIVERINSTVADCLEIVCEKDSIYIWGEYNIRYVLSQGKNVVLQTGEQKAIRSLLPSAFISLNTICNKKGIVLGYSIFGGGFGHGVGMSQNGAKHMADAGNSSEEILRTYYSGCIVEQLDEEKDL